MDRAALNTLTSNVVVIGVDGKVRALEPGSSLVPGDLLLTEGVSPSQLNFEQVTKHRDGSLVNVTDDIVALIDAISAGEGAFQLENDFAPKAGESYGSSPQLAESIDQTGAETLASTHFETIGTTIPLSETQVLSILELTKQLQVIVQEISSPTVNEGDKATFEVTLSNPSFKETLINMTLSDGSAEGGVDYTNTSVTITFEDNSARVVNVNPDGGFAVTVPTNEINYHVTVSTVGDDLFEGAETFTLSGATENQKDTASGTATIVDDSTGPGPAPDDDRPNVTITDAGTINEGDTANFKVTLSNVSEAETQVELGLNRGDTEVGDLGTLEYKTGSDWVAVPTDGVVTVPAGQTEFDVRIASIDDAVYEGSEGFSVTVTGIDAVQGSDTGTATIVDDSTGPGPAPDDDRPNVTITDAGTINEGDTANFKVTLSNVSEAETQVELGLNRGDTEVGDLGTLEYKTGSDWVAVPTDGVVTVPAGQTEFDVRIASIDDAVYEGSEGFSVTVTGIDAVQGSDTGTATIVDDSTGPGPAPDDDRPNVTITDAGTINEGDTANFKVTLSNVSEAETQVELGLNRGDTEVGDLGTLEYKTGSDWVAVPTDGVVTVPAGQTEFDVRIASIDDAVYEGSEGFSVTVTGIDAVQGSDTGTATIVDDSTGPGPAPDDDRPNVTITDAGTINEGDTANFKVTLSNVSEAETQVELGLNRGDTEVGDLGTLEYKTGSDWVAVPTDGVVTVPAGQTEFDVRIASIDDAVYEGSEGFSVTVTGIDAVQGSDTGTATIVDDSTGPGPAPDDDRPNVTITDAGTINEGDTANFKVTLSNVSEAETQVELGLNRGDTEVGDLGTLEYKTGSDWVAVPTDGVVTVPAGQTEFDVRIASIDDAVYEGSEGFSVTVTGIDAVQGSDTGTATIVDDSTGPGPAPDDDRPNVTITDAGTINEGDTANFKVTLSNVSEAETQVELGLNRGDTEVGDLGTLEYKTGSDWVAVPTDGVVTVPAGQTEFDVRIASIDDAVYEGSEGFSVTVTGIDAVQGSDTGTATIVDDSTGPGPAPDDDRPNVTITDAGTINEGDTANFKVTLSNVSEAETQVELGLNRGDTEVGDLGTLEYKTGSDWVAVPTDGVVTVPAGQTEFDVRIASIDDAVYEGSEGFSVTVTGIDAVQGSDTGTATIVDDSTGPGPAPDDDRPNVTITDAGTINEGDTANFKVTLSNVSEAETQVELGLNRGDTEVGDLGTLEYKTGSDWVAVPTDGVVTVPAGQTEFDVRIASIDDAVYEGSEGFSVTVTGIDAVQGSDTGTATIVDDSTGPGPAPDDDRPNVTITDAGTINEGDTANFKVTLSNVSEAETQVELGLNRGDTEVGDLGTLEYKTGSDWVAVPTDGVVTVPAGQTEFDVRIASIDDAVYEGSEGFSVTVTGIDAVQGSDTGTATIVDDSTGPGPAPDDDRPNVTITDAGTINEGDTANFKVTLSNVSEAETQVELGLNRGDTEVGDLGTLEYKTGSDWVAVPTDGVVTVPAGQTEFDVRIASIDDAVYEGSEGFSVTVTGIDAVQGSDTGTATIVDDSTGPGPAPDDDRPNVTITDAGTINEGDTANFKVTLSNVSEAETQVELGLNRGDTEVGDLGTLEYKTGSDWVAVPTDGVVTVPAGQTEFDVRIASIDDAVYEGSEGFSVTVTGIDAVQGSDTGTATIVDDSTGPGPAPDDDRPNVTITDAGTINEGDTANFKVTLSNVSEAETQVELGLNRGDTEVGDLGTLEYKTGSDWVAVPTDGVVTVPAGQTEFDVRIASIDDAVYEGSEGFSVTVTGIDAVQGSDTGTATIVDDSTGPGPAPDDDRPNVTITDAGTINEGDTANFKVTLSNVSEAETQVELGLNRGDTEVGDLGTLEYKTGSDWVAVPTDGVVTVPAGQTEFDVRIASIDDAVYEGSEGFSVTVTGIDAVQGSDTGTATIVDDSTGPGPAPDDDRPNVTITDAGTINEGDTANFKVTLSNVSEAETQVELGLNRGDTEVGDLGTLEYKTGSDWVAVPTDGVVTVPAGQTEFDVRIASIDDAVYEGSEGFSVTVTGIDAVQGSDTGTATIVDDSTGPGPAPDDDRPNVTITDAGTINEGDTANFKVTLSNVSEAETQVELGLNRGDTEVGDLGTLEYKTGSDWVAVPTDGVVTVPAGQTEFDVRIASIDDAVYEGSEGFSVTVTGIDAVQGSDTGTATIVDDSTGPGPAPDDDRPNVTITDAGTINEGDTANFKVTLSNVSEAETQVELGLNRGDTEVGDLGTLEYKTGSDWVAVPTDGVVTVPAGQTEFDVRIASIDDAVYEGSEGFSVTVTGIDAVQGSDTGTATIVDDSTGPGPAPDDDRPNVTITDAGTINEGDTANFKVTLSNVSEAETQVELGLNRGDTEVGDLGTLEYKTGSDWVAVPTDGVVTVPAGQTEFDVRIASIDDAVYEGSEGFSVTVTGIDAVQGSDTGTATIVDDSTGPGPAPDDDRPNVTITDAGTINEGDTANFKVTLSNVSEAETQVELGLNRGDTEVGDLGTLEYKTGSDWVAVPTDGVVTVPAGQTEFDVRIASIDDAVYEGSEGFSVTVTGIDAVQGSDTGTATIVDDSTGPGPAPDDDRPNVTITDAGTINEGDTANFKVTLSNVSEAETQVELGLNRGDTEVGDLGTLEYKTGSDWVAVPTDGVVTVPAGQTEFDVRIASIDDAVYEGSEGFSVTVTGIDAVQGSDTGTATIVDDSTGPGPAPDDDRPNVTITDAGTINEGDTANFKVTLSNVSEAETQVELGLNRGDTEVGDLGTLEYKTGSDWVAVPTDGVVTVPAGQTEFDVRIASIDDAVYEGSEGFSVTVTGIDAVQGSDTGTATIVDDSTGPGPAPDDDRPNVTITDAGTINEGDTANFKVTLSNVSEAETQVELGLNRGDTEVGDLGTLEYKTGSDWVAVPTDGVVTVPAGQTEFDVRIASIDDAVYEGSEGFSVTVTGIDAVQGSDTGTATIVDDSTGPGPAPDDDRPNVTITDAGTINEGDTANFKVTLSNVSEAETQVELGLNRGDTEVGDLGTLEYKTGSDWVAVPTDGVVTVPAGQTEFDVRIASIDDAVYEGSEGFSVTVTGIDAVQGSDTGTATIVDDSTGPGPAPDDDRPNVTITDAGTINEGDTANFKVTLSNVSEAETQVELGLNRGDTEVGDLGTLEYKTGSDWVAVPTDGVVTVPAGQTEFDVRIASIDDAVYEGSEGFSVTVTGIDAVQGSDTGTATIVDDSTGPGPAPDDDRPNVTITDAGTINEGDTANFKVTLSNVSEAETQVELGLNRGDTEVGDLGTLEYKTGSDWVAVPTDGVVTVPAGQTEFDVRIASIDDAVYEGSEGFSVTVTGIDAVQGSDTGTATIVDDSTGPGPAPDDDRPNVTITDAGTINEGDTANFKVTLSNVSEAETQVELGLNRGDTEVGDLGTLEYKTGSDWVAVPTDGVVTVPAGQTEFDVRIASIDDAVYEGSEGFSVTVTGIDAVQGSDTGTATIVDDDAPPSISDVIDAVVSEEGLTNGIPDNVGFPSDITNVVRFSGAFTVGDSDSENISVVLSGPNTLTSSGEPVSWSWNSSTQTLTASTASTDVVATVELNEPSTSNKGVWGYTFTLLEPIDHNFGDNAEDIINLDLQISASDGQTTTSENLNITIEDDAPQSNSLIVNQDLTNASESFNVQLVVDVSNSMNWDAYTGSRTDVETSRLDILKSAVVSLLLEYQMRGETKVQITTFSGSVNVLDSDGKVSSPSSETIWMDVESAIQIFRGDAIETAGWTNYAEAINVAANQNIWSNSNMQTNGLNYSYFFSDGDPQSQYVITENGKEQWKSHLEGNNITSLAYGIGAIDDPQYLDPIAYNANALPSDKNTAPVLVNDVSDLASLLIDSTAPTPLMGTLGLTGADGGYVSKFTFENVNVLFDGQTVSIDGELVASSIYLDGSKVTITALGQYSFSIDMNTREYQVSSPSLLTEEVQLAFSYALTDKDGDSSSVATLNINLASSQLQVADDTVELDSEQAVLIDVLNNDNAGSDNLTLSSVAIDPIYGDVSIVDNQVLFIPSDLSDVEIIRVPYRVDSSNGEYDTGTLIINIADNLVPPTTIIDNASNTLIGTSNSDVLFGKGGDDTISGEGGMI
ncbi:Calx-beta domain-containing protein [Vibrio vulnificus]|uniref:Calx-beta domain-containing protein n=1 Tax=Vibrio vulnificus TaxID=672 RepID=UPI001EED0BCA|nr:Calx-beta domain-containing protein [Vibrio vulnificus]